MLTKTKTYSMAIYDRDGISVAQTKGAAGTLTITGAYATGGVATLDVARHVTVYAGGNNSGVNFTVTGTARNGDVISEVIVGPNATTAYSTKNFKTVTSVANDAASTGDVEVGLSDECETPWIPVDASKDRTSISILLSSAANLKYSGVFTLQNVMDAANQEDAITTHVLFTEQTGNLDFTKIGAIAAFRLKIYDWTVGTDTITMTYAQSED